MWARLNKEALPPTSTASRKLIHIYYTRQIASVSLNAVILVKKTEICCCKVIASKTLVIAPGRTNNAIIVFKSTVTINWIATVKRVLRERQSRARLLKGKRRFASPGASVAIEAKRIDNNDDARRKIFEATTNAVKKRSVNILVCDRVSLNCTLIR